MAPTRHQTERILSLADFVWPKPMNQLVSRDGPELNIETKQVIINAVEYSTCVKGSIDFVHVWRGGVDILAPKKFLVDRNLPIPYRITVRNEIQHTVTRCSVWRLKWFFDWTTFHVLGHLLCRVKQLGTFWKKIVHTYLIFEGFILSSSLSKTLSQLESLPSLHLDKVNDVNLWAPATWRAGQRAL